MLVNTIIIAFIIIFLIKFHDHIVHYTLKTLYTVSDIFRDLLKKLNDFKRKVFSIKMSNLKNENDKESSLFKFQKIDFLINGYFPSKRSGHRAVYNELDDSLFIWGGYNPQYSIVANETQHNLYPEVNL